ncbi:hypothetical protein ACIQMJ_30695 [Actinosynnema sp. NPDC091369]
MTDTTTLPRAVRAPAPVIAGPAGEFLGYWDEWKCDDNNTLWVNK